MTTLRLVLGDQLNPLHSWFTRQDAQVVHVLMEVRQETDYVVHHAQKVIAIFAAMRDFARWLRRNGHRVHYLALDHPDNRQSLAANLDFLLRHHQATALQYQVPDEWRVDRILSDFSGSAGVPVTQVDSEHFYTSRDELARLFGARGRWTMETFYRHMRRTAGVLVGPDGTPEGGRWNFDEDNRKPWRGDPAVPRATLPAHDHRELWRTVQAHGVKTFGAPRAESFPWPLNRTEALAQLDAFIAQRLPNFGAYQDAMASAEPVLFHSLLSFALNTKMLNPREVVARACDAWRRGLAPLAAVEGFVRQILGWREYVRGYYWARMPDAANDNALDHRRPLPRWFWTGATHMRCLALALRQSLDLAYAHHIQRLMVIGNFALLAGLAPGEVHQWYLGVYIDAFEWVELPNTLGMSQYADAGRMATKPYVSGAAYIQRMSDYCKGCRYKPTQRTGSGACPYNALYWNFFAQHAPRFERHPRLALTYRQLASMPEDTRAALKQQAQHWLENLDEL